MHEEFALGSVLYVSNEGLSQIHTILATGEEVDA